MTELSPQARAVLAAADHVYWDWCDMSPASSSTIAAAALRAAALYSFCPIDRRILATIADEPENHQ